MASAGVTLFQQIVAGDPVEKSMVPDAECGFFAGIQCCDPNVMK